MLHSTLLMMNIIRSLHIAIG